MHSWPNILLEMFKFQDIPFTKSIGVKMFLVVAYLYLKIYCISTFWFISFQEEQNKKSYKSRTEQKSSPEGEVKSRSGSKENGKYFKRN